jgi:YVTN family beta-propeller protein
MWRSWAPTTYQGQPVHADQGRQLHCRREPPASGDRSHRSLPVCIAERPRDVVKVNLANDSVLATVHTGERCRSLAISADGRSLYVVNYESDTVTKLRASDLRVLQNLDTGVHPIGITYDAVTGDVWVAVYSGQILVLADR